MGWWSITDKNGGISPYGNIGLCNGDGPADILDNAIKEVIKEYEEAFGRKPYIQELQAAWNFSTSTIELENASEESREKLDRITGGLNGK